MFMAVLARRLRPGATVDDFVRAWYPERGFGAPVRGPVLGRDVADEREIITVAYVDLPGRDALGEALERVAAQEATRHERIDAVVESTRVHAIYEVLAEYDFSTDATVARDRPAGEGA